MKQVKQTVKGADSTNNSTDGNSSAATSSSWPSSSSGSDLPFRLEVGEVEARKVGIALAVCAGVALGLLQLPLLNEILSNPLLLLEDDYPL